jgi:hypothetical protein
MLLITTGCGKDAADSSMPPAALTQSYPRIIKVFVTSSTNDGPATDRPKNVTMEDEVTLHCVVKAGIHPDSIFYFTQGVDLVLGGRRVPERLVRRGAGEQLPVRIEWYEVKAEKRAYNNVPGGNWSLADIDYREVPLGFGGWSPGALDELGTTRYKAEVTLGDRVVGSPGRESQNDQGIGKDVHRISVRKDDSFVGWIYSFFKLPYIFGNTEYQVENYIGADCADLVVGALRKSGHDYSYTNADGLSRSADEVIGSARMSGLDKITKMNGEEISVGEDIREGDLIFYHWPGRPGYTHVSVFLKDRGPFWRLGTADHVLNIYDRIVHTNWNVPSEDPVLFSPFFPKRDLTMKIGRMN